MYKSTYRNENRRINSSKSSAKNCNAEPKEKPKYAVPTVCIIRKE